MTNLMEGEALAIAWRQNGGSTFHKRKAEEAATAARIAAQRQARLTAQGGDRAFDYNGELVRNPRVAGPYGGD
jgi:hypothetical protein